jgi:leader peptidase (prepilin peptidase)/N-methyltransferase
MEWVFISLGLKIGSFLNVCVVRIPRRRSIVSPRSSCTHCGRALKPYDNIPLISFLVLGGKCRFCKGTISWQYPVVEALTTAIFWGTFASYGLQWKTAVLLVFFSALVVLVFIDLNHRLLPDVITLPGIALGIILSLTIGIEDDAGTVLAQLAGLPDSGGRWGWLASSLLGALVCGGFLWLVGAVYFKLKKMEGLGGGDLKLMAMVGAFLGVKLGLLTIMLGSVLGVLIGLAYIRMTGKDYRYPLPFGTFLGIAAIGVAFWGEQLLSWYLGITGRM